MLAVIINAAGSYEKNPAYEENFNSYTDNYTLRATGVIADFKLHDAKAGLELFGGVIAFVVIVSALIVGMACTCLQSSPSGR